jgi:hypothetical protein
MVRTSIRTEAESALSLAHASSTDTASMWISSTPQPSTPHNAVTPGHPVNPEKAIASPGSPEIYARNALLTAKRPIVAELRTHPSSNNNADQLDGGFARAAHLRDYLAHR